MEPQISTGKWQIIAKFSMIYSLVLIALNLILFITGLQMKLSFLSTIVMIITVVGSIYFGTISLRNNTLGGYITYGQSVGTGMLISLFAGIIMVIYSYIYATVIDPDFLNNMVEEVKRKMIEEDASEEKIEQSIYWMKKMSSPWIMMAGGLFSYLFYGLIASLIVSIFTKKEDPDAAYKSL